MDIDSLMKLIDPPQYQADFSDIADYIIYPKDLNNPPRIAVNNFSSFSGAVSVGLGRSGGLSHSFQTNEAIN